MRTRPIPSTGGRYLAGEDGRIYSARTGRPLKAYESRGRAVVSLYGRGRAVTRRSCRLVAEAWCDGFTSATEVHHANRDPLDDRPGNLVPLSKAAHLRAHGRRVDDADFADCEAMAKAAPPPAPLFDGDGRIERLMEEAARAFGALEEKGAEL